jgi:hypothetical protein
MIDSADIIKPLRPATLTRLLNSTPLGVVVAPHDLYRHRAVAGGRFEEAGRVDLVRYAAWLFTMRTEGASLPGRRRPSRKTIHRDGSINKQSILALLERQGYRCALTGRPLAPQSAALDHIIPVSRGGDHCIGNAQVLDKAVNRAKGALTNDEFIDMCGEVWQHRQACASTRHAQHPPRRCVQDPSDVEGSLFQLCN